MQVILREIYQALQTLLLYRQKIPHEYPSVRGNGLRVMWSFHELITVGFHDRLAGGNTEFTVVFTTADERKAY